MRYIFLLLPFYFQCIYSQTTNYSVDGIPEELINNANAVVRSDQMKVRLISQDEMSVSLKRVVTVLNTSGNKHVHSQVGYNNSIRVKEVQALVFNDAGTEVKKFKEKEFKDVSAVDGGTLYSDSRVKYLNYTPTTYPYTIEFSYEIITKNTAFIPSWYFLDGFMVSTQRSEYSVSWGSPDLKPEIRAQHLDGYAIETSEDEDRITYVATNIPAIKDEALSPAFSEIVPNLMVRPTAFYYEGFEGLVNTWDDLGSWMYNNMLVGRNEVSEKTKNEVLSLVLGVTDPIEKAKKVYQYVQDNMRYISVQVGIGGIQPISAIEVDKVKYGDCKGLSNYTRTLLEIVGVEAYYVHVEAGNTKTDFIDDFPDLSQGNHVILAIPDGSSYQWIDCTSKTHPFGFLGDFTDDRKVLVIKPDGGELQRTPRYIEESNMQDISATLKLKPDLGLEAEVRIQTTGTQYDRRFFLENEDRDDVEKYYKSFWGAVNNLDVRQYRFENKRDSILFVEHVDLEASNYAVRSGDRLFFIPNSLNRTSYVPKRYRKRELPFEISRGYMDLDDYTISLPVGYEVEAIPEDVHIDTPFGTYKIRFKVDPEKHELHYTRSFLLRANKFPNDQYEDYRNFRKEVAKFDQSQIVLKQS